LQPKFRRRFLFRTSAAGNAEITARRVTGETRPGLVSGSNMKPEIVCSPRPADSPRVSLEEVYRRACDELMNSCSFFCDSGEVPALDHATLLRVICGLLAAIDKLTETFDIACPPEPEKRCLYQPPPPSSPRPKR